jgi:hypothetical protein
MNGDLHESAVDYSQHTFKPSSYAYPQPGVKWSNKGATSLFSNVGWSFKTRPDVANNSGSPECIARVHGWLNTCIQNHPLCSSLSSSTHDLPKRIIDVGGNDSLPRLLESNSKPISNKSYVALSHCWGTAQPYTTEKNTTQERMHGMPWHDLPKTFQDAIILTRSLGIQYLWIDSLCIVQDDLKDWAKESSKMSQIYTNATLTIAAAAAKDGTSGFLNPRTHFGTVAGVAGEDTVIKFRKDIHNSLAKPGPLVQRGWVFQERMLSRRVLYYESHEMVWECRMATQCECGSDLFRGTYRPKAGMQSGGLSELVDTDIYHASPLTAYQFTQIGKSDSDTYNWWRNAVVQPYSALQLTKPMDRLPALSGLAAVVRHKTRDIYLAGIWLSDLARGLLWESSNAARVSTTYIAPSWSWASINGAIQYRSYRFREELIEIVDCRTDISTVDPTGAVSAGELRVRCPILRVTSKHTKTKSYSGTETLSTYESRLRTSFVMDTRREPTHADTESGKRNASGTHDTIEFESDPELYLAFVGWWQQKQVYHFFAGIVLRLSRSWPKTYERVGIWEGTMTLGELDIVREDLKPYVQELIIL